MEPMTVLLIVWGVLTTALAVLLIYRSALSMHEDGQIFLDSAESHLEREQQQLALRMDRLRPFVKMLGASSGLLAAAMVCLWMWRAFNRF